MHVRGPHPTRRPRRLLPPATSRDDLEALRKLVVGPEQARLDKVERPSPVVVGSVLPEAVAHAAVTRPEQLAMTFEKPVTNAVRQIARRDPAFFGEVLAPTIGTAVRRAVADALAALMQRINLIVESRLSLQSVRWRLEARRTKRPYAEIVIARTLVFRVEWAVLIDVRTSLVLAQASSSDAAPTAPDQTAAMLAAINSFVSDAMQVASPGAALQAIEAGDLSLWIERDSTFAVAVAIRGVPPVALRDDLRCALQLVHTLHREAAVVTDALVDAAAFEDTHPVLLDLCKHQVRTPPNRAKWIVAGLALAILIVVTLLVWRGIRDARADDRLRAAYGSALASVPGVVVTSIERGHDRYVIHGLRDPRAPRTDFVLAAAGLPPAQLQLAPYESLDPRFAKPMQLADAEIRALEALGIDFQAGRSEPLDASDVDRAAAQIDRVQRAAAIANAGVCIEVLGDSDVTGRDPTNADLRSARALGVVEALKAAGVPGEVLAARGGDPLRPRSQGRRVTFHAVLRPLTDGGCR